MDETITFECYRSRRYCRADGNHLERCLARKAIQILFSIFFPFDFIIAPLLVWAGKLSLLLPRGLKRKCFTLSKTSSKSERLPYWSFSFFLIINFRCENHSNDGHGSAIKPLIPTFTSTALHLNINLIIYFSFSTPIISVRLGNGAFAGSFIAKY